MNTGDVLDVLVLIAVIVCICDALFSESDCCHCSKKEPFGR